MRGGNKRQTQASLTQTHCPVALNFTVVSRQVAFGADRTLATLLWGRGHQGTSGEDLVPWGMGDLEAPRSAPQ